MQEIKFFCRKCKCSMHMSMYATGKSDAIVMNGMVLKCHRCKKASVMKNFTEGMVIAHADNNNRFYL